MRSMADDMEWTSHARVVRAGLRRFADEGHWCWTRENLDELLRPYALGDPRSQQLLGELAAKGAAEMTMENDACSLRILDPSLI
jgi:hypothetical protein